MEMQIVIDIPEREYEVILNNNYVAVCACPHLLSEAIKNGTPLPKGHGRLIDADELPRDIEWSDIDNAPTIIEADTKGEEEE